MGFLSGKRALIVGVATDRSIAWGIAQAMHREGAALAFSYLNDKLKDRVVPLAQSLGASICVPLDVTQDAEIHAAFAHLKAEWEQLDIVVHAVAFAPREALAGFASEPAIVVAAVFVLGGAIFQTGLSDTIGVWIGRLAGTSLTRAIAVIMPAHAKPRK